MDLLQQCALKFERLLFFEYIILLGRKGKTTEFVLSFEQSDFHHLAGLHKLKDNVRFQTGKREHIYREILAGQLTLSQAGRSAFFHEMSPRLAPLINLESFLDSNKTIFHYNSKLPSFSSIKADYLLENIDHDIPVYLFLSQRSGKSTQVCRTFFPKGRIDYTLGQPRCTLLCKEKRNLSSGKTEILYNRLSKNL